MELTNLLNKEIEELYFEIGKSIDEEKNALPKSFKKLADIGHDWIELNLLVLQEEICKSKTIIELANETDKSRLFVAIADIVAAQYSQMPFFTISALVVKIGVNKFCSLNNYNAKS